MEDINKMLLEARAAAARQAAIRRETERALALENTDEVSLGDGPAPPPPGMGELLVERRQGKWRCFLCEKRIRSGDDIEVYVNQAIGWVHGRLHWQRSPHTPPSIRVQATHPDRIDSEGERETLGEIELLLAEEALCRWPQG